MIDHPAVQAVLGFLDTGLLDASGWQIVAYALLTTHVTIAAVTIYLHRCQAHRALDLHPVVSHFFRGWLWLTTGMVTKEWASIHRKHHAKCETPEDPHSPQTRGIRKVLLEGTELYRAEAANAETMQKYGHGTPDDWIERHLYTRYSTVGVYLTLLVDVLLFGAIGLTVFAVQMLWIPVTAAGVINGIDIEMSAWIADPDQGQMQLRGAILKEVLEAFRAEGIEIPFPQRDVRVVG